MNRKGFTQRTRKGPARRICGKHVSDCGYRSCSEGQSQTTTTSTKQAQRLRPSHLPFIQSKFAPRIRTDVVKQHINPRLVRQELSQCPVTDELGYLGICPSTFPASFTCRSCLLPHSSLDKFQTCQPESLSLFSYKYRILPFSALRYRG